MTKKLTTLIIAGSMLVASSVMAQPAPSKTTLTTTPAEIRQGLAEDHAVKMEDPKPAAAEKPVAPKKATHKKTGKKHAAKKGTKHTGKKTHKKSKAAAKPAATDSGSSAQ